MDIHNVATLYINYLERKNFQGNFVFHKVKPIFAMYSSNRIQDI